MSVDDYFNRTQDALDPVRTFGADAGNIEPFATRKTFELVFLTLRKVRAL